MTVDDVFERLAGVVRETFHVLPGTRVLQETTSADIDGWDSLSHAMLIMQVEEEFGVELPIERIYSLENVGELAELIRTTLEEKS